MHHPHGGICHLQLHIPVSIYFKYNATEDLREYLDEFQRLAILPIEYNDLTRYDNSFPLLDAEGNDTFSRDACIF